MSPVLRPTYKEGQILGAADLNTQLTYERLGMVLHERTEHLWGVAQGLGLETTDNETLESTPRPYVDVSLAPGRAVDRLGRAIVVTEPVPLDPEVFKNQFPSAKNTDLHPVFVQAIELPRTGETQPGRCAVALITRIEEGFQISFGSPGEELSVLDQAAATVDEGFGTPALADKVLVGWVKFESAGGLDKFIGVATESTGIRIRHVGVVASQVVAGGGELALRTRPDGPRFAVSLTEDSAGGCVLKFGKQDGNSPVVPVFSIDEKGNIVHAGTLTPAPVAKTLAESGVAFDGVRLPLPAEVSEGQVNDGSVRVHVVVTPWPHAPQVMQLPHVPNPKLALPLVVACSVDATRRVRCRVRWYDVIDPEHNFIDLPSACTYVLVASGK